MSSTVYQNACRNGPRNRASQRVRERLWKRWLLVDRGSALPSHGTAREVAHAREL